MRSSLFWVPLLCASLGGERQQPQPPFLHAFWSLLPWEASHKEGADSTAEGRDHQEVRAGRKTCVPCRQPDFSSLPEDQLCRDRKPGALSVLGKWNGKQLPFPPKQDVRALWMPKRLPFKCPLPYIWNATSGLWASGYVSVMLWKR